MSSIKRPPPLFVDDNLTLQEDKEAVPPSHYRTLQTDMYNLSEETQKGIGATSRGAAQNIDQRIIGLCSKENVLNRKTSYLTQSEVGNNLTGFNSFVSLVYGCKLNSSWIKIYRCREEHRTVLEAEFIFEVYYQTKAFNLNAACNFISPRVHNYGSFEHDEEFYCYIIMDFISEQPLSKDQCVKATKEIKRVDACLQTNGIYHNDAVKRNVFKDSRSDKLILIDFGLSLDTKRGNQPGWNCSDSKASFGDSQFDDSLFDESLFDDSPAIVTPPHPMTRREDLEAGVSPVARKPNANVLRNT